MDMLGIPTEPGGNHVELLEHGGEWFVRITENATETISKSFEREAFAMSFAEGQCVRLGIAGYLRA